MTEWTVGKVRVCLHLGPYNGSGMGLVLKSKERHPKGTPRRSNHGGDGALRLCVGNDVETSVTERVEYWPPVSVESPDRRKTIYRAIRNTLTLAKRAQIEEVGLYTLGLEVARVPSWEVADEIVRALRHHSSGETSVRRVVIVTSSPTQLSSVEHALKSISG
ncbi:MAG: hypothetical protein HXY34_07045 [Candidatus Thorarchaeota archaeon]|nr:hypothetical protein [Candidatus Thorarchaeota archaeon]